MSNKFKFFIAYSKFENQEGVKVLSRIDVDSFAVEEDFPESFYAIVLDRQDSYKSKIECVVNMLTDFIVQSISFNKQAYDSNLTQQDIDIKIAEMLKSIGMFMGYLINSTSWDSQKIKDFDAMELINRLQKIITQLTYQLQKS